MTIPTIGDNGQLRSYVERIERLEEEKKALGDDVRDVYAELKGTGFDPKIVRKLIALRKQDASKLREEQELLAIYMQALGMLVGTELGDAALKSAGLS